MPEPLRDVIARHGLQATKALGQNFILDRQLLARIAAIPGPLEGATVYEVGPGPGGLTRALLDAGANVVAVERDRRCLPALAELEADFAGRLRIISGDALKIDERAEAGDGAHVVANLPYNVGTALLLRWLGGPWPPWWASLTLMFQTRGRRADRRRAGQRALWPTVGRGAVALDAADRHGGPPLGLRPAAQGGFGGRAHRARSRARRESSPAMLERLTAAAFGQRRKMLRSSLKGDAGSARCAGRTGDRLAAPRRNASASTNLSRWRERLSLVRSSGVAGVLAAASAGPRAIAVDSVATCGQPLAAELLQLGEIFLGARQGAQLDHRLALDGKRVAVGRLQRQRLVGQADRLAVQLLLDRDPGHGDEGGAVLGIDRQRRFQRIIGFDRTCPAASSVSPCFSSSTDLRRDLVVGRCPDDGDRQRSRRQGQGTEQAVTGASIISNQSRTP